MKVREILVAGAWLLATVGMLATLGGRAINLGFVAALALAIAAALSDWRALAVLSNRVLLEALLLGSLAFVVPASMHGVGVRVWLGAARGCSALAWFAFLLAVRGESARQALAWAALALLVGNLAFALASPWLPTDSGAFEIAQHEYVRVAPRFRGLANSPAPAGVWALVAVGLAELLPTQRLRWLARSLGLLEACASLSIAALAVPALLVALLNRSRLRWGLTFVAAAFAAAILYFQPLDLALGSHTFAISSLHPSYASEGRGPTYMPQKTLALPGITLHAHATVYGKLAARGLTCFAEHPLVGVGPGRFRKACRVMAMNTLGEWTDERDPQNQVGGVLSELGSVGVALLICAWLVLRRRYRLKSLTAWPRAVWTGLFVCALGSEALLALPVLALFASQLEPRGRSVV